MMNCAYSVFGEIDKEIIAEAAGILEYLNSTDGKYMFAMASTKPTDIAFGDEYNSIYGPLILKGVSKKINNLVFF